MNYKTNIARTLRKNQTKAEARLWKLLRNRNLEGLKFRRQYPIKDYIVDFCCIEQRLIIELDGKYHLEKEQKEKDELRDLLLKNLGYRVLRFNNDIVFKEPAIIFEAILKRKEESGNIPPSKQEVESHPQPDLLPQGRRQSTVLSTKTLSKNQKELLLNAGLSLVEYDAIKIEFQAFSVPSAAVENAIITSKNAAKAVIREKIQIKNCFCVGDKTATLLSKNGFNVLEIAPQASALAEVITTRYSDKSFTFFCGNKRREELPKLLKEKNVKFEEIEVYRTSLNFREFQRKFDGILFFSPSGVQSFAKPNKFENAIAFCIGGTTASEAKKYTDQIEIANQPGIENVIARAAKILK